MKQDSKKIVYAKKKIYKKVDELTKDRKASFRIEISSFLLYLRNDMFLFYSIQFAVLPPRRLYDAFFSCRSRELCKFLLITRLRK